VKDINRNLNLLLGFNPKREMREFYQIIQKVYDIFSLLTGTKYKYKYKLFNFHFIVTLGV